MLSTRFTARDFDWRPLVLTGPISIWLSVTVLRETPIFWRNEGGYDPAFRALVLYGYYPGTALLLLMFGVTLWRSVTSAPSLSRGRVCAWAVLVLALAAGLGVAGANNLANLIDGRPLHYHAAH